MSLGLGLRRPILGRRLPTRQARITPLVAAVGKRLQKQRLRIAAKLRPGEKLAYIHRHRNGLQTLLHDGRVEIEPNGVENLIRPIALSRSVEDQKTGWWIVSRRTRYSPATTRVERHGAHRVARCDKANDVESFAYLKATLEAIANGHPQKTDRRTPPLELQVVKLKPTW